MFQNLTHPKTDRYQALHIELVSQFGVPEQDFALRQQLNLLLDNFPTPESIAGLRILDIGCGSISDSADSDYNRGTWGPWLCRAVTLLGGHAVGVDIGRVALNDTFEFHRADLTGDEIWAQFADHSFDAISCNNLFSSPHLVYRLEQSRIQREAMSARIKSQTQRLLKFSGKILCFDNALDNH